MPPDTTAARLEASRGAVSVGTLTDAAGVSGNHLATQFKSHLGVTPKRVARIYRFARLILSVDARHPVDWAQLAHTAGYFDQAHFSKEFKDFTGHEGIPDTSPPTPHRQGIPARQRSNAGRLIFYGNQGDRRRQDREERAGRLEANPWAR